MTACAGCFLGVLIIALGVLLRQISGAFAYKPDKTVKIIFDTDMDTDVDDMGALAVLHSYIREGRAELLAAVGSCNSGYAAACIDAVNTYYGLPDIPVGISPECPSSGKSKYQRWIAEHYPNDTPSDADAKSAVDVYRETLAKAEKNSVVLVVTGPLNNLRDLLFSESDGYSGQTGMQLVAEKVKVCVIMGGRFPKSTPKGEYNIRLCPQAAAYVSKNCPVPVLWCGWEAGNTIMTGARIGEMKEDNPVRAAYELYGDGKEGFTRSSWDLIAMLCAVEGTGEYWREVKGRALFLDDAEGGPDREEGYNQWREERFGKDAFLVSLGYEDRLTELLDKRMVLSEAD